MKESKRQKKVGYKQLKKLKPKKFNRAPNDAGNTNPKSREQERLDGMVASIILTSKARRRGNDYRSLIGIPRGY